MNEWTEEGKKKYMESKNNINENNIDIYILIIKRYHLTINIKIMKKVLLKLNLYLINY